MTIYAYVYVHVHGDVSGQFMSLLIELLYAQGGFPAGFLGGGKRVSSIIYIKCIRAFGLLLYIIIYMFVAMVVRVSPPLLGILQQGYFLRLFKVWNELFEFGV